MAKLYFKYGAMGSSKTAQALITKFNYEERGMRVWLIKPALDTRDGAAAIRSRIGLEAQCFPVGRDADLPINIPAYKIELKVSPEELERRRAEMPLKRKENITGYLKRYAAMVSSADKGAIINR